jgi:hypothetical protein
VFDRQPAGTSRRPVGRVRGWVLGRQSPAVAVEAVHEGWCCVGLVDFPRRMSQPFSRMCAGQSGAVSEPSEPSHHQTGLGWVQPCGTRAACPCLYSHLPLLA